MCPHFIHCFLLFLNVSFIRATGKCNTGQIDEDKKFPCCANYFPVEGVCRACPPGLFGNNCSVPCQYPYYGILCVDECKCDRSLCDVITGCPDNNTDNTTGKGSIDYSTTGTSTPGVSLQISIDYRNSRTSNDKLRIGIIGVGSALVSLTVFSTIIWILKSIFRKIRTQAVTDGCSDDVATVYMEIDDGSNHGDIQEQLGRTVIEEPETSPGDRTEERPELPERMTVVFTSDVDMLVSCTDKDPALSMGE
ncbi:uncharacterized protein LOC130046268 isoform X2 [Ostrea edulis]|uniref:uncharacterized protein LOC130046268 isoform X2 n=1 Tax=Ostrea edulis TaxID=37623 RepID=UPI0024AEE9AB|nr:uncharacterized protein LOC130046268 isoform X2 [Ostrea edulis]